MTPYFHSMTFPLAQMPQGIEVVERFYQLDAASLCLAEFWSVQLSTLPPPDAILLASPHGSNENDFQFVTSGLASPQKFVHTLPSVRIGPLCQMMKWQGPVLTVQKDPRTFAAALQESATLALTWKRLWVIGVLKANSSTYEAILFEVTPETIPSLPAWNSFTDIELWERLRKGTWNR